MLIVDSQVHVWEAERPDRPWLPGAVPQRAAPFSVEDLLADMADAGVDRAVLVPPAWIGNRNDAALRAAHRHPERFAVMGRLPLNELGSRDRLDEWTFLPGMLGVRLNFRVEPHRSWLHDGTADWIWPQAEALGLAVMVFAPHDLPRIGAIAAAHPGLRITLDHLGLSSGARGEAAFAEQASLLGLAALPNIAVKASALPCVATDAYPYPSVHDHLRRVFDAFGPQRLFWGSDLTRLPCSYRQAVTMFAEALPWLHGADLEQVMGRAICAWLGWPVPGPAPAAAARPG
jgi:predicted TIM-barrel fold metal-dependent hydrolase